MKKTIFLLTVIFFIILIYFFTKPTNKNYLILGIDDNSQYIINKKHELIQNNVLGTYNTKYLNKKYRIIDLINDINNKKEIENKTILNYIIKADYITLNIGYNDLNSLLQDKNMYNDIDQILCDMELLFKLIRTYSKENVSILKITTSDSMQNYVDSQLKRLCAKYNIDFIN